MYQSILILCLTFFISNQQLLGTNGNTFSYEAAHPTEIKTVQFPSDDKLSVTADLYFIDDSSPVMILCHQAGYSRGEYIETAKTFNQLGYNCIAIDQRSGKEVNDVINKTAHLAAEKNLKQDYLSAEQDIIAAVNYASKKFKNIILVGSSYSASLVLKIAAENKKISAVIAFSPGEYFGDQLNLKQSIYSLDIPCFISSSQKEFSGIKTLTSDLKSKDKLHLFLPKEAGKHGSKALWSSYEHTEEYWCALKNFLKSL